MNNEWICKKPQQSSLHMWNVEKLATRDSKSDHGIVYCVLKSAKVLIVAK